MARASASELPVGWKSTTVTEISPMLERVWQPASKRAKPKANPEMSRAVIMGLMTTVGLTDRKTADERFSEYRKRLGTLDHHPSESYRNQQDQTVP